MKNIILRNCNNALSEAVKNALKELAKKDKEKQEQVRKLKVEIYDMYHRIGKSRVWHASNDEVCNLCEDYFEKKINEIFQDCILRKEKGG